MKSSTKKATIMALINASEMIRGHLGSGAMPEDIETDEYTFDEYGKACKRAASMIDTLIKKYSKTTNQ